MIEIHTNLKVWLSKPICKHISGYTRSRYKNYFSTFTNILQKDTCLLELHLLECKRDKYINQVFRLIALREHLSVIYNLHASLTARKKQQISRYNQPTSYQ